MFLGGKFIFGKRFSFLGMLLGKFKRQKGRFSMRKKSYKGKCIKRTIEKSSDVCRTYDSVQLSALDFLNDCDEIKEIRCNVPLDSVETKEYTTDFLCVKIDGDLMVRECTFRKLLQKPLTAKLLDLSRVYWLRHGVSDWGIIIDAEK